MHLVSLGVVSPYPKIVEPLRVAPSILSPVFKSEGEPGMHDALCKVLAPMTPPIRLFVASATGRVSCIKPNFPCLPVEKQLHLDISSDK